VAAATVLFVSIAGGPAVDRTLRLAEVTNTSSAGSSTDNRRSSRLFTTEKILPPSPDPRAGLQTAVSSERGGSDSERQRHHREDGEPGSFHS
jgi:hypothetical protein